MNLQQMQRDLQKIDVQTPEAWPNWVRVAAAVLAFVLVVGLGFWLFVRPALEALDGARASEGGLRADFQAKQIKVSALDAYKVQLAEMERSFGAMLRLLPSKAEVANLLNDISQTRIASGLEEELFQPQPDVLLDFYAVVPNRIVELGSYHQLGSFVSGVAGLPRIVTIDEVELKPAGGNAPSDQLRMTALAKTYRYLDEEEQAAAARPAKGKKP